MTSLSSDEIDPESRHRKGGIYRKGIDSQTLNSKNIKHTFSITDVTLPGSADNSGPPSPQAGPPPNFGIVQDVVAETGDARCSIYRSSFPQDSNIPFLEGLGLKSIITLVKTEFTPRFLSFMVENKIKHYRLKVQPHKKREDKIPIEDIAQVLKLLLDPNNGPILIHCNKGKHRTGCLIAALRKVQASQGSHWSLDRILTEYHKYADPKARAYDEAFISAFKPQDALDVIANMEGPMDPITYTAALNEDGTRLHLEDLPLSRPLTFESESSDERFSVLSMAIPQSSLCSVLRTGPDPIDLTEALQGLRRYKDDKHDEAQRQAIIKPIPTPPDTESGHSSISESSKRFL